jgi:basic membrane protein A
MSRSALTRRKMLEGSAMLGAAGLITGVLPVGTARAADLTVGFIFVGRRNDWGWNQAHAAVAQAVAALPNVNVIEAGYVPEATDYSDTMESTGTEAYLAEIESLIADGGASLIFSTSIGDDVALSAAAEKYPHVTFRHVTSVASSDKPENLSSQNALINQGHYVNGVAAGLCTKTNKLGFVAGEAFAPILLNINSFLLGSRLTNPKTTVQVIFSGGRESEAGDADAANKLVDDGCDVIACHLDSPKVAIETAEARGVKSCGHAFDQATFAPQGFITGAEYRWTGMYEALVTSLQSGAAMPGFVTGGYDRDYVRSSPFGAGATPEAITAAEVVIEAMTNDASIFVGPIKDNTGEIVVPVGTTYGPYAYALQQTDYLIEGVIGEVPG